MVKVKVFDYEHEKDLENEVNKWLASYCTSKKKEPAIPC